MEMILLQCFLRQDAFPRGSVGKRKATALRVMAMSMLLILPPLTVWADNNTLPAPSEALSATSPIDTNQPLPDRVTRLERQLDYFTNLNLPQTLDEIHQQLARLNGELDEQAHQIQTLSDQQKEFYQDLNQRVQALGTTASKGAIPPAAVSAVADNPVTVDGSASSLNSGSTPNGEIAAYQQAFNMLGQKQYEPAEKGFKQYLTNYPQGTFAANAYYWLGEISLQQKRLSSAETSFNKVVTGFPKSAKVPDAQLKLAIIHARQGKLAAAKKELQAVKTAYPSTTAAKLAELELQQLNQ